MKTAILVTGQYRPQVNKYKPQKLIQQMESVFKTHMFFHTWNDSTNIVPIEYHNRLVYCAQPELDYHPVSDIEWVGKHGKWEPYVEKRLLYNKMQHASKQILAYADLLTKIPDDFDVLIRIRWDILVSEEVNFKPYLEKAYEEGPVGFMTRGGRKHNIDRLYELPKAAGNPLDLPRAALGESDIEFEKDDWYGYLPDNIIMHRRDHFDIDQVKELHREKNLAPAEWGWYQILSEPYGDIHTSVHGGAQIAR